MRRFLESEAGGGLCDLTSLQAGDWQRQQDTRFTVHQLGECNQVLRLLAAQPLIATKESNDVEEGSGGGAQERAGQAGQTQTAEYTSSL